MIEAEILAESYEDVCVIERYQDIEDPETGLTEQNYVAIHDGDLICALSQTTNANRLAVVEGSGNINVTIEEQKLFIIPGITVKKGDRITITQSTGHTSVFYASKPFYYPSHTEIKLSGREIDG